MQTIKVSRIKKEHKDSYVGYKYWMEYTSSYGGKIISSGKAICETAPEGILLGLLLREIEIIPPVQPGFHNILDMDVIYPTFKFIFDNVFYSDKQKPKDI